MCIYKRWYDLKYLNSRATNEGIGDIQVGEVRREHQEGPSGGGVREEKEHLILQEPVNPSINHIQNQYCWYEILRQNQIIQCPHFQGCRHHKVGGMHHQRRCRRTASWHHWNQKTPNQDHQPTHSSCHRCWASSEVYQIRPADLISSTAAGSHLVLDQHCGGKPKSM